MNKLTLNLTLSFRNRDNYNEAFSKLNSTTDIFEIKGLKYSGQINLHEHDSSAPFSQHNLKVEISFKPISNTISECDILNKATDHLLWLASSIYITIPHLIQSITDSSIMLNGTSYPSNLPHVAVEIGDIYPNQNDISWQEALNWLYAHKTDSQVTRCLTAFTYAICRTTYEALIYSVIALESIYIPEKSSNTTSLFKKRLRTVFGDYKSDEIYQLYAERSKYVHGSIELPSLLNPTPTDPVIRKASACAISALLRTLRLLVKNNAGKIMFSETVTYELT